MFFFQAEDGIRDLVRSRGLGDVYKRQVLAIIRDGKVSTDSRSESQVGHLHPLKKRAVVVAVSYTHLTLPTSDLV